jgi:hypothetical protein
MSFVLYYSEIPNADRIIQHRPHSRHVDLTLGKLALFHAINTIWLGFDLHLGTEGVYPYCFRRHRVIMADIPSYIVASKYVSCLVCGGLLLYVIFFIAKGTARLIRKNGGM